MVLDADEDVSVGSDTWKLFAVSLLRSVFPRLLQLKKKNKMIIRPHEAILLSGLGAGERISQLRARPQASNFRVMETHRGRDVCTLFIFNVCFFVPFLLVASQLQCI